MRACRKYARSRTGKARQPQVHSGKVKAKHPLNGSSGYRCLATRKKRPAWRRTKPDDVHSYLLECRARVTAEIHRTAQALHTLAVARSCRAPKQAEAARLLSRMQQ